MKAQLPADPGGLPAPERFQAMRAVLEGLTPEAVYFYPEHGVRTTLVVFDLKSPGDMPVIAEPLFRQGATVEFSPVMNLDDLQAGMKKLGQVSASV
jgi:hypothetical protein